MVEPMLPLPDVPRLDFTACCQNQPIDLISRSILLPADSIHCTILLILAGQQAAAA
jgi:hypothetical protein